MRRVPVAHAFALGLALAATAPASPARADAPYRLRADALVATAPGLDAGLLTLAMDARERPWLRADALVWLGSGSDGEGDALVMAIRLRDPRDRGELHLGRFVRVGGAIRPVHLDGAEARARLPWRSSVALFGGVPVRPALGARAWDWVSGGRVARELGPAGAVGIAFQERRSEGRLELREVGVDGGGAPAAWLELGARVALSLVRPGVSDAYASAAARRGALRVEAYASHLSPSRLLPATSLFSVLGDVATDRVGLATRWRAAPRLDLTAGSALRPQGDTFGVEGRVGAVLRLDDRGDGALGLELARDGVGDAAWIGSRGFARFPLGAALVLTSELELVRPDTPAGRGALWPWGLVALVWHPAAAWDLAAAAEARSSPTDEARLDGLVRLTRRWGAP